MMDVLVPWTQVPKAHSPEDMGLLYSATSQISESVESATVS